jgi:branched-chain amino acid transport system substrate-binding protein
MKAMRILASLCLVFFLGACYANAQNVSPSDPPEIVIGVLAPLSGPLEKEGAEIRNGAELSASMVNGEHYHPGIPHQRTNGLPGLGGAKLRLVFADDQGNKTLGAAEAERLISEEKAVALMGSYSSDVTAAESEVAERLSIPFICPVSSAAGLTNRGFQWFFRTGPCAEMFVENLFSFLDDMRVEGGNFKISLLTLNNLYGNDFQKLVIEEANSRRYDIAANISYDPKDTNLTDEVLQLKDSGEAVLIQASYLPDAILSMKTYKELNYTPLAIIGDDSGFIEQQFIHELGDDAENIFSRETWARDSDKYLVLNVNDVYHNVYGYNMNGNSARSFMGLIVLAKAIDIAGSTDPEAIRISLLELSLPADQSIMPWKGVQFDPETHENVLSGSIIVQIQKGRYRTVWPNNETVARPVWPPSSGGDAVA